MVDFTKHLTSDKRDSKPLKPSEIYEQLDRASDKGPLRPAQEAILSEWYDHHRASKDTIVKLHTGQGKTLIGMLILQSRLNQGLGPAVYLCPNNYLVAQTVEQARQFGIHCVTATPEIPPEFFDGESILVTSVQKLFNGLTRFGLGSQSVPVGALVMDDSHACADAIRDSCIVRLSRSHKAYFPLFAMFSDALREQGIGTFTDIELGKYDAFLPVPYWEWIDRHQDVAQILAKSSGDEELRYVWPILKDVLRDCICVFSGTELAIAPYLPPLHLFGSYSEAKHRVFMSATVTNDSILVKGLGLSPKTVKEPLVYSEEKWSGEKMILIPSLIQGSLDRDFVIAQFAPPQPGRDFGIVALTPSFKRAEDWKNAGALLISKVDIETELSKLKAGNGTNTLVLANRYDGIDLPDRSCRILILDSLPFAEDLIGRWLESCRPGSEIVLTRVARTIEQGLGRAVRGERDYCVIVLIGPDLVNAVRTKKTRSFFSGQTRKQIEIGLQIAKMAKEDVGQKKTT